MSSRNSFASILMACLLAAAFLAIAPAAQAASFGQSFLKTGQSAETHVIEIKGRGRPRPFPIAPSYLYYDYPYYYSRGHYPTHIGPGFIYFGHLYKPRYGARCSKGNQSCVAGWAYSRGPLSRGRLKARRN